MTTKTKVTHTPGPWEIVDYDQGWEIGPRRENPFGYRGKTNWIQHCAYVEPLRYPVKGEAEANAHLIAAAPELYAIVRELAEESCYMELGECLDAYENGHAPCRSCMARVAIAKAGGR